MMYKVRESDSENDDVLMFKLAERATEGTCNRMNIKHSYPFLWI